MIESIKFPALSGCDPEGIFRLLSPIERFRAKQIFKWIARGATDFDRMTDLSASLRAELKTRFRVRSSTVTALLESEDGTKKLQIALEDGAKIEAVLLVDGDNRKTACLSSQAGCPMRCAFCKTGTLGFLRNLTPGEIVDQFLHLQDAAGPLSNVVVMGMGEPLLNLDSLSQALTILSHPDGLFLSKRRFTISTSGIIAGIRKLADEGPVVRLAVSLTTADQRLRERLMPVTKTDPLPALKVALAYLQEKREKRITLEAVLLGGINTRVEDADAMADFAQGLDVIVNLIPWNPVEDLGMDGIDFKEPSESEVQHFERMLIERRLLTTRRFKKGRGVAGACGQLGSTLTDDDDMI
ncbi:MAG: 23S rRNA (adenine(2503)-C(2))-methyltransferase RlmN [Treponemataceae bacterium]